MKNVKYMMAITIVMSLDFFTSIEMIYFMEKGLPLSKIYMLYSIFSVLIVLLEVPSGYIGDKIGYKTCLCIGYLLGFAGTIGFLIGHSFATMCVSYFFMALMASLLSGTEEALIYDSLLEYNEEFKFESIYSKIKSYGYAATIIGSILAGVIAEIDITLNPICNGIAIIISLLLLQRIEMPNKNLVHEEVQIERCNVWEECHNLWGILLMSGLFMTSTLIGTKFSQPLMIAGAIPLSFFGVFSAICSLVNMAASYFAPKFVKIPFITIMLIPSAILCIIGLSGNGRFVLLLIVTAAFRAIGNVKLTATLNDKINNHSNYRATINSIKSLLFRLFYAGVILIAGFISDKSIYISIAVCGFCLSVGILILGHIEKNK